MKRATGCGLRAAGKSVCRVVRVRVIVRVIVRVGCGGAALAVHPTRIAIDIVLFLPDRHPMLHFVDDVATGTERLITVWGADTHPDSKITDVQFAEPVHAGRLRCAETLAGFGENALAFAQRERLERLILKTPDLSTFVEIPDPAFERDVASRCRVGEYRARGSGVDRLWREAEAGHGALVSRRRPAE